MKRLAGALLVAVVLVATASARETPLATGDTAPDFTLVDQRGRTLRLSDAIARRDFVVVAFYVKAFTGG